KEEANWFTGEATGGELEPFPQRSIDPEAIHAIQFVHFPPEDLPITANTLYRVVSIEPLAEPDQAAKELPGGDPDRYYRFTFQADGARTFSYAFHLDDPGVNFFTHREIMALAMKSV
ncbi:MAG: hypothetical protein R3338_12730, partial [Thermoanaerobaculia bacterium]|nr:hypothetical protein [Thermoanaerobaculia bacterium]